MRIERIKLMKSIKMKRCYGFTLAEVLITLAIIGVVAALSIPAVISNSQQQEFKTGLRKAVSVLNSAITMNMALDGESPYDNANLFGYLQKHMSIMKSKVYLPWLSQYVAWDGSTFNSVYNMAFYTTDGMRFEFDDVMNNYQLAARSNMLKLHESDNNACVASYNTNLVSDTEGTEYVYCGGCGSYGLNHNPNNTTKVPCAILVDVNGDKKPTPQRAASTRTECLADPECSKTQEYKVPKPEQNRVSDIFVILITDDRAFPYGIVAQKAMYQARK